jgi:LacI family transcriptional regulator, galactose operon repressor
MTKPLRIAVVLDMDWPLKRHHEPYSGIQDYAKEHAPHWELVPDEFPARWIARRDEVPGYDAIFGRITTSTARAAERAGVPVVNVWLNSPVRERVPSVLVDYSEAGRMAAEHLVSRGLRRLACAGYRRDVATRWYVEGVRSVAQSHRIPMSRHLANFSNRRNERNWHRYVEDLNRWIDDWRTPIGIAAVYDNSARVLALMCRRRGLHIPEQVAIIGGGDEPVHCEGSEPELTSIDMGFYRAGFRAAELLDHLLRGGAAPAGPIMTPPADLVPRQSTDVYAVADKTVGRAMRFIAEHCGRPIRVGDVAARVHCGRRKLERQFREAGRRSINEEIVALRIELSKRLLASTDDPIEQVAAMAGYGTAQHMRHVFRHQLGVSPTAFRDKHRK